jgi:hypothetical protein
VPDLVLTTCLSLVAALVVTSAVAFVRSHRKDDTVGSLVGLGALVVAGVPAAAYGAMATA